MAEVLKPKGHIAVLTAKIAKNSKNVANPITFSSHRTIARRNRR